MSEFIQKYIGNHDPIRASIVINTNLIEGTRQMQNLAPVPTIALGRAITGALMLASNTKENHKVGLQFQGNGPIGNIYAEADFEGNARGCTGNPKLSEVDSVKDLLGIGLLTVFNNMGENGMYQGRIELRTSEIGDDIAYFLYQSQQIPSMVSLGVKLGKNLEVIGSGGVIIELMPGHTDKLISKLENNIPKINSLSEMIANGASHNDIKEIVFNDVDMIDLNFNREINYKCECSEERVKRSLKALNPEDLKAIESGLKHVDVTCEFCGKEYHI